MRNKIKQILEDNYWTIGFDFQTATEQLHELFKEQLKPKTKPIEERKQKFADSKDFNKRLPL